MDVGSFFRIVIVFFFLSSQVQAQSRSYLSNTLSEDAYKNRISEYFYNKTGAEVLRQVKLLGQVSRPGIYHIPAETNLTTLLSIAGGTDKGADLNEITISNPDGTSNNMDLQEQLRKGKDVSLRPNDIIFVPEKRPTFDPNITNGVLIFTSIISVALTAYVVFKK